MEKVNNSWESRMAARARARQAAAEADYLNSMEAKAVAAYEETAQRDWLNGWHRSGNTVLVGNGTHCVCCGRCTGVTCVVFPEDWEPPGPVPVWPFGQTDCPLCLKSSASSTGITTFTDNFSNADTSKWPI